MLKINRSPINRSLSVGFNLKFTNGWIVSVQFGMLNHCENKNKVVDDLEVKCINAEVAAWDREERWYDFGDDTVRGYLSADEVSDFIHMIRNLEENYNDTIK